MIHEKIITGRLEGVEITLENKEDIFRIFSNPESIKYTDNELHHSIADSEKLILKYREELFNETAIRWGIKLLGSSEIIGVTGFYHIDFKHRFATVGSVMSEQFQGKGLMPEMQKASFQWAFEHLKLNRIDGQCFVRNVYSIRFLEKLGFVCEGRLRQNFLIDGIFEDSYIYGLLKENFLMR